MADSKKNAPPELAFTKEELVVISNALNEVCHGLPFEDAEFQTRIGVPRDAARKVLEKVAKALKT